MLNNFANEWRKIIAEELATDVGSGDITAELIAADETATATIITREAAVICGVDWVNETCRQVDPAIQITWQVQDGAKVKPAAQLATLSGLARSIVTAERTALNGLQTLSGTATLVHQYVEKIKGTAAKLLDTRKTIPGLRHLQKYAVRCGGGYNHRMGLYDMFLIKENHIASCGSLTKAVEHARSLHPEKMLEVEVENLIQLKEALPLQVSRVMLDNFNLQQIQAAVKMVQGKVELEVSGNVTLENIRAIAETGIDYISVGSITKNVRAIDLSLRIS